MSWHTKRGAPSRRQILGGSFAAGAAGLSFAAGGTQAGPRNNVPAAQPAPASGGATTPFPKGFAWGVATAAYQIEGAASEDGKGPSVWDVFCKKPGAVFEGHSGDVACDHYHRYKEDVALMKRLGVKSYRFSISWPRVLPAGTGAPNAAGFDFYKRLLDELQKADVAPLCTLFHWDFPQALQLRGGWLNRDVAGWFGDYAARVADQLGDRIGDWVTQNEPQCFIGLGLKAGVNAPGDKLKDPEYLTAAHNGMRAHAKAVQALRAHGRGDARRTKIGYVLAAQVTQPAAPNAEDVEAARWAIFSMRDRGPWNNTWWTDPILLGRYPEDGMKLYGKDLPAFKATDLEEMKQPIDFLGLNIYKADTWRRGADGKPVQVGVPPGYPRSRVDWQPITPAALYWGPRFFHERYQLPMSITENGLSTRDQLFLDGKVHDPQRIDYMHRALLELGRALKEGLPISGYYAWSLLDNFEWADGYKQRFGLTYVDYQTQRRIPKDSFDWYRRVIASGGKSLYGGQTVMPTAQVTDAG